MEPKQGRARTLPDATPEATATPQAEREAGFPMVGQGASAGRLVALEAFFTAMPADSGLAFVEV